MAVRREQQGEAMNQTYSKSWPRRGMRRSVAVAAAGLLAVSVLAGPAHAGEVDRIGGADRIATAVQIYEQNRSVFTSDTVVLVRSDDYADALTATPLAAAMKAPVLTTPPGDLDERVLAALKAQGVKKVIVIGGNAAVSPAAIATLTAAGVDSERIGGATRYETALKIASKVMEVRGVDSVPVFLATGANFADALAAGSAAAAKGAVVLLTQGQAIDPGTAAFIKSEKASSTLAVGGPAGAAMNSAGVAGEIIAGVDRYDTAAKLAKEVFPQPTSALLASGVTYADSLAGAALAAITGAPLLLTASTSVPAQTRAYLDSTKPNVTVIGGTGVIPNGQISDLGTIVDTPPAPPVIVPTPIPSTGPSGPGDPSSSQEPTALNFTEDLTPEVLLSAGDFLSLRWQTNWTSGVTYQVWMKAPGSSEFTALGAPGVFTGMGMVDRSVESSGTQYQVVAFWKGKQYKSKISTVTVVASSNPVTVHVEPLQSQDSDDWQPKVPVTVTVDGIDSSADGRVTIQWSLDDPPYLIDNANLEAGAGRTYSGFAYPQFAGTWKIRAAFHPKNPTRHSLGVSSVATVAIRPAADGPLSDVTVNASQPGAMVVGKGVTLEASVTRDGEPVTTGEVTFFLGESGACHDSDGRDGWSCPFTPFWTPGQPKLRVKYDAVVDGRNVAKSSSPIDVSLRDFTVALSSGQETLDDIKAGADTVPLTANGTAVKLVAEDGVNLAGADVVYAMFLGGGAEEATVKPVLGVDTEGDLTISVPADTKIGRWQFRVFPRIQSGGSPGAGMNIEVNIVAP